MNLPGEYGQTHIEAEAQARVAPPGVGGQTCARGAPALRQCQEQEHLHCEWHFVKLNGTYVGLKVNMTKKEGNNVPASTKGRNISKVVALMLWHRPLFSTQSNLHIWYDTCKVQTIVS